MWVATLPILNEIIYFFCLKIDTEISRLGFPQVKKLSDSTFGRVFSKNPRNELKNFTYNCHLCGVAKLPDETALQIHIKGRKHQQRLAPEFIPDAQQFRSFSAFTKKVKNSTDNTTFLETIANVQNKPLIGLEYVIKLIDVNYKEATYICTLCDKKCDPRNIIPQLTSHRHRLKYLVS